MPFYLLTKQITFDTLIPDLTKGEIVVQRCLGCMRKFGEEFEICPYCGYTVGTEAKAKNHLAPGTVLQNRYTLGKVLGQGGFGITYIAWDGKIGRAVAVKEYMPYAFASRMTGEKEVSCYSEEARQHFLQGLEKTRKETYALSQFGELESVVKVHDCIEENGTAYIIMELLRGRTAKEILSERGRLTFAETMHIMTPVLQTLDAMHNAGMIHRDIAPDNIFVCEDGRIKLLDFGAARVVSGTDEKTLSVMLKAGYAPVEQYSSRSKQGPYTDVYAASATMYKMLTGETPPDSLSREPDGSDLAGLSQTDAPQAAQETILRGMAQKAAGRIQSATELLQALQASGNTPTPPKKKNKALRILAAVLAVLAIGTAVYFISRPSIKEPDHSTTAGNGDTTAKQTETEQQKTETTVTVSETETTQAAQPDTKWIAAYKTYLSKLIKENTAKTDGDYGQPYFSLIYFDNDDIPDLVVAEEFFHPSTATLVIYENGELHTFPEIGSYGCFQYKERKSILVEEYAHSGVSGAVVWHLTQGSLKCVWDGMEVDPYLVDTDSETPECYLKDPDIKTAWRESMDDSILDQLEASERKVSEAEYQKEYNKYVPTGLRTTLHNENGAVPMTQQNVAAYFDALTESNSIPVIRESSSITAAGTISEKQSNYNEMDYYDFRLDQPVIVRFAEDDFPSLITEVRIDGYQEEKLTVGHTTLKGHPFREADGSVWLTRIIK